MSGQPRTTPVMFWRDGERLIVVASNSGKDQYPAWYWNLKANPPSDRPGRPREAAGHRRRSRRRRAGTPPGPGNGHAPPLHGISAADGPFAAGLRPDARACSRRPVTAVVARPEAPAAPHWFNLRLKRIASRRSARLAGTEAPVRFVRASGCGLSKHKENLGGTRRCSRPSALSTRSIGAFDPSQSGRACESGTVPRAPWAGSRQPCAVLSCVRMTDAILAARRSGERVAWPRYATA